MGDELRITRVPPLDATPKAELNALVAVYRFVLDCHAKKEDGPTTAPDDAKKESTDVRARAIILE